MAAVPQPKVPKQGDKQTLKCKICQRPAHEKGYCHLHYGAYESIIDKFRVWQRACGLPWIEYLGEIQKNSLTGEWAKEVAKQLIGEEKKDVQ